MMRSPVRRAATAAIDIKAAAEDRGDVETHPSMMPGDDSDVAASTAVPFSLPAALAGGRAVGKREWRGDAPPGLKGTLTTGARRGRPQIARSSFKTASRDRRTQRA
jgi:hypothetical protein